MSDEYAWHPLHEENDRQARHIEELEATIASLRAERRDWLDDETRGKVLVDLQRELAEMTKQRDHHASTIFINGAQIDSLRAELAALQERLRWRRVQDVEMLDGPDGDVIFAGYDGRGRPWYNDGGSLSDLANDCECPARFVLRLPPLPPESK